VPCILVAVQAVALNGAGTTNGMLGYMFWAAEFPIKPLRQE
jgi:hypothetical protein